MGPLIRWGWLFGGGLRLKREYCDTKLCVVVVPIAKKNVLLWGLAIKLSLGDNMMTIINGALLLGKKWRMVVLFKDDDGTNYHGGSKRK
jgi:hypothetical protein